MRHIKRLLKVPTQSFFLLRPRGTGKTTWLKDHYTNAVWIDLLLPNEVNFYAAKPGLLISKAKGAKDHATIVIDEIHCIPVQEFLLNILPSFSSSCIKIPSDLITQCSKL